METTPEKFDRANGQGKNHDTEGNVANAGNDTLKQDNDSTQEQAQNDVPPNDAEDLVHPTNEDTSNKGQGPAGEDL